MERNHIIERLQEFIGREVLDGADVGLDASTPLLQYGIINSITLVSLLAFIQDTFAVEIPAGELRPENLRDLGAVADLLLRAHAAASPAPRDAAAEREGGTDAAALSRARSLP